MHVVGINETRIVTFLSMTLLGRHRKTETLFKKKFIVELAIPTSSLSAISLIKRKKMLLISAGGDLPN